MSIMQLVNVRGEDILECGVKGAQLGELLSIGLPVPSGFVITTDAYKDFMEDSDLEEEVEDVLSQVDKDFHNITEISAQLQNIVQQVELDGDLADDIMKGFKELGAEFVAVRSSAVVAEDPMVYYEGKMATSLNVQKENLLSNVEYCWASLYTDRSLKYRYENNLDDNEILVAVIVQEMVDAQVSGIVYTKDPDKKTENTVVVQAGWGLGEAMVSGIVSPDRYVVDKESFEVLEATIGLQLKEVVREEQRHRIVDVSKTKQKKRKLTDEQVLELARLSLQVEEYYGTPQKLEWARDGDHTSVLQTKVIPG